jgi:hypothetical protein
MLPGGHGTGDDNPLLGQWLPAGQGVIAVMLLDGQ